MNCCGQHGQHKNNDADNQKSALDQKATQKISAKWFYLCGLGVIGGLTVILIFKVPLSSVLLYGLLLACPIMHFLMMGGHKEKKEHERHD